MRNTAPTESGIDMFYCILDNNNLSIMQKTNAFFCICMFIECTHAQHQTNYICNKANSTNRYTRQRKRQKGNPTI